MKSLRAPKDCQSMAELRPQIDAIDAELISLLTTRSRYIDRAAELKKVEGIPARVTDRIAEVLDNVSAAAAEKGFDPVLARTLWSQLIEWSIAREEKELGE